ncbi:MAG: hypothetical protein H6R01_535 [Burkholderiaceae bacterium]|nr:hypothetical protein [Burkholderiaceae bacterium]
MMLSALIRGGVRALDNPHIVHQKVQPVPAVRTVLQQSAPASNDAVAITQPEKVRRQLESFALDTMDDNPADRKDICRINNMAWEFMQSDGLTFQEAINLAAEIVVKGQVAQCEAAYADVLAFWRKLTTSDSG